MDTSAFETNGYHNGSPVYCPVNCTPDECLQCDGNGLCHLAEPFTDCDDFGMFWQDWAEWEVS